MSLYEQNFGVAYANALPSLGESMVEILRLFNANTVFGVGGDFAANLITALENGLEVAPSSNEMHAGLSACGQAEISGLGVALTTYTVGSLPCTTAAALAKTEKLPVIFISGAPGEKEIKDGTIHHTVASFSSWRANYDCAINAFAALGIKSERLQGARSNEQPNMAAERFFQLVCHAYLNKEPVFIEVPRDLVFEKTQSLCLPDNIDEITQQRFILKGAELITDQIKNKIANSQYPLVYVGENVKLNTKLKSLILDFCHKHNIPYATSWLAKGIFDESHPLCLGAYNGVFSQSQSRNYIEGKTDYILEVDTSIHRQDTSAAFNTGTHKVYNFENKTTIKGTVQNSEGLIRIFSHLLESDDIKTFEAPALVVEDNTPELNQKIDFHNLAETLNSVQSNVSSPLVYLPEVGNSFFASFGLKTIQSSLGRSWLTNPWYAAMGTSIPYARAVCKTIKEQAFDDIAVVLTGDGGFNFQHNELVHFLRENLSVIIVYMRNNIFHLGKSSDADIYHCSTQDLDVIKLIEAYGGEGVRCTSQQEFYDAMLGFCKDNSGVKLIEVAASLEPQYQCQEIQWLNTYIKCQNGDAQAAKEWALLKKG